MMTDDEGRRRVELASETITKRIGGITGDIPEEEENKKQFKTESDDAAVAAGQPTSRT